jgi:hypothetical protein
MRGDAVMLTLAATERSCQRKNRYWSEVDALIVANKRIADGEEKKLRAYKCKLCGGFHLTSAKLREK